MCHCNFRRQFWQDGARPTVTHQAASTCSLAKTSVGQSRLDKRTKRSSNKVSCGLRNFAGWWTSSRLWSDKPLTHCAGIAKPTAKFFTATQLFNELKSVRSDCSLVVNICHGSHQRTQNDFRVILEEIDLRIKLTTLIIKLVLKTILGSYRNWQVTRLALNTRLIGGSACLCAIILLFQH